ncbi:MAG: cytochrome b N-terminal domain-containing protein [Betaproteobacteria bacterium]|nr:cytochrome b N-terminal domain-containing protein [Betaproteobacteria bacterium]
MTKRLQHLLQWLFMRVEALFNAAFGDKLNPLYHLGAITFFQFWIVVVSGLYLYAFFETSVAGAYASVDALTHGQWYAGGIMRSVHRYASDGMVLTMLIHMLRHYAFDRLHGFRWFSWVTGVMLIWLVYVSGINGYMLPWDKTAQFVVTAGFEWLDWLPMFGGALIRNFIYQASVNDRLFSLLSFIHLGAPLLVLLLMWIHVQRVPKASTNPPRPIIAALLLSMLALALLKPALSQGGAANFGMDIGTLEFDWFYLAIFPLPYLWPLGRVWALVSGATALLALLPWLPPKFRRGAHQEFHITVHPDSCNIPVRAGETILEAGLRAGLALPFECRNGGCGACCCAILNGSVNHGTYQPGALSAADRALGQTLMCCAVPLSDIEIEYAADHAAAAVRVQRYNGRIERMERLSDDVMRLILSLPSGETIAFAASQYINILLDNGQRRAFSFANLPHQNDNIELHVRLVPSGLFTTHVFTQMQVGDSLQFEGPLGAFTLHESTRPIIFVAGATGFAPIKSIVEDAFQRGIRRPMLLYWGVRRRKDLYMLKLADQWQRGHPNYKFIPVLSEAGPEDRWPGRTGLVHEAIVRDFPDLTGYQVYVCGSVKMVETAFPAFLARGLTEEFCFSDAFLPAVDPRKLIP